MDNFCYSANIFLLISRIPLIGNFGVRSISIFIPRLSQNQFCSHLNKNFRTISKIRNSNYYLEVDILSRILNFGICSHRTEDSVVYAIIYCIPTGNAPDTGTCMCICIIHYASRMKWRILIFSTKVVRNLMLYNAIMWPIYS